MRYELIDHTADFGLRVFADNPAGLFAAAAMAMFEQITRIKTLTGKTVHQIRVTGLDWPDLMVNWLRELLYLWTGKQLLVHSVRISAICETELAAAITADPFDPQRHRLKMEIKAVTYHGIGVERRSSGWQANIIFDV